MFEVSEGLPVAAVQRAVGDPQQLCRTLHVNLLVLHRLQRP